MDLTKDDSQILTLKEETFLDKIVTMFSKINGGLVGQPSPLTNQGWDYQ